MIVHAGDAKCFELTLVQCRKKHRYEDADNSNYNQKFDQCKSSDYFPANGSQTAHVGAVRFHCFVVRILYRVIKIASR